MDSQSAPSWFNADVSLGAKKDATSASNIKAALTNMEKANRARKQYDVPALKVSPVLVAISMIDADYQKSGLTHPQYYKQGLENLAAGAEPVNMWLGEKSNWKWNVKKNPSLAAYEFVPNWGGVYNYVAMGTNSYKTSGHYLNLLNRTHTVMGMAHMTGNSDYGSVDAFNASSDDPNGALSLSQYKNLVNEWLSK